MCKKVTETCQDKWASCDYCMMLEMRSWVQAHCADDDREGEGLLRRAARGHIRASV